LGDFVGGEEFGVVFAESELGGDVMGHFLAIACKHHRFLYT
jgi:hypothetical protein